MCSEAIVRSSECNRNFLTKGVPGTLGSNKLCSKGTGTYEYDSDRCGRVL